MKLKQFNKATAAVVAGAVVALLGAFLEVGEGELGAVQTLITAVLVALVPNRE